MNRFPLKKIASRKLFALHWKAHIESGLKHIHERFQKRIRWIKPPAISDLVNIIAEETIAVGGTGIRSLFSSPAWVYKHFGVSDPRLLFGENAGELPKNKLMKECRKYRGYLRKAAAVPSVSSKCKEQLNLLADTYMSIAEFLGGCVPISELLNSLSEDEIAAIDWSPLKKRISKRFSDYLRQRLDMEMVGRFYDEETARRDSVIDEMVAILWPGITPENAKNYFYSVNLTY